MAGASSSSSSGGSWKYDVFINFRGEDTRKCFVCHLYEALKQKALNTFIDSEELRKGDDLSELLKAIQSSRLSIVVFSKNYASSKWCLKELVQILECRETKKQIVVPIFYEVEPSDVRKWTVSFEESESWKSSLTRAANVDGWVSKKSQDDSKLIKDIVEDISKTLIGISISEAFDSMKKLRMLEREDRNCRWDDDEWDPDDYECDGPWDDDEWDPDDYEDKASKTILYQGKSSEEGLFLFKSPQLTSSQLSHTAFVGASTSHPVWHQRLGHPSHSVLSKMLSRSAIKLPSVVSDQVCTHCLEGKMHRLPFSESVSHVSVPFSKIHSDLWA